MGGRVRGSVHGEDEVLARCWALARQPAAQLPTGAVHRSAEDAAVGTREVDVLEDALPRLARLEPRGGADAVGGHLHDLAGLDLALRACADDVERAALRREDRRV